MRNPDYYVRYDDFGYSDSSDQKKLIIRDWIKIIVFLVFAIFVFFWAREFVSTYNELTKLEKESDLAFSNVQATMQERLGMISHLENIVNDIEPQRENIIGNIYKTSTEIESATSPEELDRINEEITNSFNNFLILVGNNLIITENEDYIFYLERIKAATIRINNAREKYNTIVKEYNKISMSFPGSLIVKIFDFETRKIFDYSLNYLQ